MKIVQNTLFQQKLRFYMTNLLKNKIQAEQKYKNKKAHISHLWNIWITQNKKPSLRKKQ